VLPGVRGPALGLLALLAMGCAATVIERTPPADRPADVIITGATVLTLNDVRPEASAFAITDGRFRVIGGFEHVEPFIGPNTEVVDAAGQFILPGLVDAHLHLFGEGYRRLGLDLVGTVSRDEVIERVAAAAQQSGHGGWIRGRGWDQNDWPETSFPSAADLDRVVSDVGVVLSRIDGHAIWVNSKALEIAGISRETPDPDGGRILRDETGAPTGILVDEAESLIWSKLPARSREEMAEAARVAAAACVRAGLTGIHEPGIGEEELDVLRELYRAGEMPLRIYAMLSPGPALEQHVRAGPEVGLFEHHLTVRAVKIYLDGALGSRGAALLAGYADEPGNRGLLMTSEEDLEQLVRRVALARLQPCVHAIGDRANRLVLDVYQRAYEAGTLRGLRPRIEHAQHVAPDDLLRFASLGVVPSMQPTHATSDMPWAEERLGSARLPGSYAWSSLHRSGARLAFGSDAPVESVDPFWGIYSAVTRADHDGEPAGGWLTDERLSVLDALKAFTLGAAYAAHEDGLKGSIAPGKLADFIIVDRDFRHVPPAELLQVRVLATYVGGRAVYRAD